MLCFITAKVSLFIDIIFWFRPLYELTCKKIGVKLKPLYHELQQTL